MSSRTSGTPGAVVNVMATVPWTPCLPDRRGDREVIVGDVELVLPGIRLGHGIDADGHPGMGLDDAEPLRELGARGPNGIRGG